MVSSLEVWVLYRINELAQRCGLRPSDVDIVLSDDENLNYHFTFHIVDPKNSDELEKQELFKSLLGLPIEDELPEPRLTTADLREFADMVERALARAPRARHR